MAKIMAKCLIIMNIMIYTSIISCKTNHLHHDAKYTNISQERELIELLSEYIEYSTHDKKCNIITNNDVRASLFPIIDSGVFYKKYSDVISIFGNPLQIRILKDGGKSLYYPLSYYVKGGNKFSMLYVLFFNNNDTIIPYRGSTLILETEEAANYWHNEFLPNIIKY
ncbi:MAG: hypothetical protein JNM36_08535 [Chitinophagales bacterium]|nr:hypothetical protein [Chitinophagales bacterium]